MKTETSEPLSIAKGQGYVINETYVMPDGDPWYNPVLENGVKLGYFSSLIGAIDMARKHANTPTSTDYCKETADMFKEYYLNKTKPMTLQETLEERGKTHGVFEDNADIAQALKKVFRQYDFNEIPDTHKEALDMFASKIARVLSGGFNHKDNWRDIAGYAELVVREIERVE